MHLNVSSPVGCENDAQICHKLSLRQRNVKLSKRSFTARPLSFHYFSRFPEYYKSTTEVNATASVAIVTVTSISKYPGAVLTHTLRYAQVMHSGSNSQTIIPDVFHYSRFPSIRLDSHL